MFSEEQAHYRDDGIDHTSLSDLTILSRLSRSLAKFSMPDLDLEKAKVES